jgi:probable rRNA maturation factor
MINMPQIMDNAIELVVEETRWNDFGLQPVATTAFAVIAARLNLANGPYELSILACDDARIAVLNAEFRGKDTPTNVLSWPGHDLRPDIEGGKPDMPPPAEFGDPYVNLGDIALAYETCLQQAQDGGIEPRHHITHLLIHGMLHLLGYDHETDADAEMMETLEIDLLADMTIGNPYQNV